MHRVILDMDPGIDDALALILALQSPEVEVLAVTTVAGNAPLDTTSANALRVLEYLDAGKVPVVTGAAEPLEHPLEDALDYHGPDGLGNCQLPAPTLRPDPARAWDFVAKAVSGEPGGITLVATGPLTNVALAFGLQPHLPGLLAGLVIMGGAFGLTPYGRGNRTPVAEFNIWQDPEAAHEVFSSGVNVVMVGLDVTMDPDACLNSPHLEQLRTGNSRAARLVAQLVEYEIESHGCCRMHDPLALAALLDPSMYHFVSGVVQVDQGDDANRGRTRFMSAASCRLSSDSYQQIHVASSVDGPRFVELFLSRVLEV